MQRVAHSGVVARSDLGVRGVLQLIRRTHAEHDARIAMSDAIHQAEVVVIGGYDSELGSRIALRLDLCGGRLAEAIGPETRFAVRGERATADDVDAASGCGVAVIDEADLERMLEVYEAHASAGHVHAAVRRAVDANRVASSIGPAAPVPPPTGAPARRMVTSRQDAKGGAASAPPRPLSEDEQELEQHARNVRSLNDSTPFRHQRPPRAQPR
jgi:hypothetical protein